jgi:hypothetical protein
MKINVRLMDHIRRVRRALRKTFSEQEKNLAQSRKDAKDNVEKLG